MIHERRTNGIFSMILQYAFIAGLYHESMQVFSIGALIALTAVLLIPVATAFATDHVSKGSSCNSSSSFKGISGSTSVTSSGSCSMSTIASQSGPGVAIGTGKSSCSSITSSPPSGSSNGGNGAVSCHSP